MSLCSDDDDDGPTAAERLSLLHHCKR